MTPPLSFRSLARATTVLRLLPAVLAAVLALPLHADVDVTIDFMPGPGPGRISPYIYGTNDNIPGVPFTLRRQGGNRMTGYNWENNASNAGADYYHQSDDYLTWKEGITGAAGNVPGLVMTRFQDQILAAGVSYSIITLPMAGYVAADKDNRRLTSADAAPSPRWIAVINQKPTALSLTPDLTDGKAYTDEMINLLVTRYGPASSATGIKAYSLDNEPDLWSAGKTTNGTVDLYDNATHPLLHPAKPLCAELITRSVDLAKTVKRIDPSAETFGFVSYGFSGYRDFQSATDWATEKTKGSYTWFVDYYLDQMSKASATAGQRLLDVIDLHNYSEARGGGLRINDTSDYTNLTCNKARLQAPRTFWDATYTEDSWIGQWNKSYLPWLPKFQASIDTFYPGTKLAITEYNFGGEDHITGGIALADILGVFGRYGVYAAALWPFSNDHHYAIAAFNLYLNYDGQGGKFGDTSVKAYTTDTATATVWAATESSNPQRLHVILLNKSYDAPTTFNLSVLEASFDRARVFAFDATSATITERAAVPSFTHNRFTYTLPALTAAHFVLEAIPAPAISLQPPATWKLEFGRTLNLGIAADGTGLTYQWRKDQAAIPGATATTFSILHVTFTDAGSYDCVVTNAGGSVTSQATTLTVVEPLFTQQPANVATTTGGTASFTAFPYSSGSYGWQHNGVIIAGSASVSLSLTNVQPADTGVYALTRLPFHELTSDWALLGLTLPAGRKVEGLAHEIGSNIYVAANGNTFDQVLLEGAAATITADFSPTPSLNQITRVSFIDLDDDIVQVEYSGPGTLSLVLDHPTGPALPVNYNQATTYLKGHASIVITGANEFSNVSVFSVGRANAVNQALFKDSVTYDGIADLAFIAIASTNGKFGGVRTANASYFAHTGPTGVYAPGVTFAGPVFVGDITAFDTATPVLITGGVTNARITGGDLLQANAQPVQVRGLTQLQFTAGGDSHGHPLPVQTNHAVLLEDGNDVTARLAP